jgi:hypothetical protein
MTNQRQRKLSLALLAAAAASTASVRSAEAAVFDDDQAAVSITVNGQQCPHIFTRTTEPENPIYISWTCKSWGGTWPTSVNRGKFANASFALNPISAVSSDDGDIFLFYKDDYQQLSYIRRLTGWPQVSLGQPPGAGTVVWGPQAVAFTEGGVRKVAVFITANYQGVTQLWMDVYRGDTNAFDGWVLLGYPGTAAQNNLRIADFSVSVASDGVNPATISMWVVGGNNVFYENSGTATGGHHWTQHAKTGTIFSPNWRPAASGFYAQGAFKSSATVVNSPSTQAVTYTRFNTGDAFFGPLVNVSGGPTGGRKIISTGSGNRDLPTSIFFSGTSLLEESYDYLTYPGIVDTTLATGISNYRTTSKPIGLYRSVLGPEDVLYLSTAGDLMLFDGSNSTIKNFGHP